MDVVTTTNGAKEAARARPSRADREDTPSVSVVITCHNQAQYLDQAIESVLAQDYAPLEVIVVDAGSTDDAKAVVDRYPEVRYVRQQSKGLAAARNTGLRESEGDALVFLDADDWLLEDALEASARVLREHPECAFVAGGHLQMNARDEADHEMKIPDAETPLYPALLRRNVVGAAASVMYRRNALVADGGFDPSLPAAENYDLCLRLARRYPTRMHTTPVAAYRKHADPGVRDPALMHEAVLEVLRRQEQFVQHDEQLARAHREGVTHYTEHYGRKQLARIKEGLRRGGRRRRETLRALAAMWWHLPGWMTRRVSGALLRRLLHPFTLMLPVGARRSLARWRARPFSPPVLYTRFGDLRRTQPISRSLGYDRGTPIHSYYIERYLARRASDIRGRVLEVGDNTYTRRFGGERVTQSDILHVDEGKPTATFVDDLTAADHLPSNAFDCVVLTQTLHLIYDVRTAIAALHRVLKPGGVLLATFPGLSPVTDDVAGEAWYWTFTRHSARRLFEETFPPAKVEIEGFGNVLAATAFLQGLAAEELDEDELDAHDPSYDTLLAVRAEKPMRDRAGTASHPQDNTNNHREVLFPRDRSRSPHRRSETIYARRFALDS